jgi:hypothetical protein
LLIMLRVFVPVMPFQPSLMFVGKAMSLTKSRAPVKFFTQVGSVPINN